MCLRIGLEDLAANALIELLEREEKREVLFEDLRRYGDFVVRFLEHPKSGKGEDVVLVYARDARQMLFSDYSAYFEPIVSDGINVGIRLRAWVGSSDLWSKFRARIPVRIMCAFMDDVAFNVLMRRAA